MKQNTRRKRQRKDRQIDREKGYKKAFLSMNFLHKEEREKEQESTLGVLQYQVQNESMAVGGKEGRNIRKKSKGNLVRTR